MRQLTIGIHNEITIYLLYVHFIYHANVNSQQLQKLEHVHIEKNTLNLILLVDIYNQA